MAKENLAVGEVQPINDRDAFAISITHYTPSPKVLLEVPPGAYLDAESDDELSAFFKAQPHKVSFALGDSRSDD